MKEYIGKELIIMACSKCNADCTHCYISYKGNRTSEELLSMVKKLKEKYELNINGAEILTDLEYLKSYKEIKQEFVLSNGKVFLQHESICNKLKENNIKSISISYHFGIHDDISPVKIKDLNKIINIIKKNNLEFRLLTTITSENYKLIPFMCEYAKKIGAKGIKFTNFINQGNAKNLDNTKILNEKQITYFFKILEIVRNKYDKNELLIERCGTFGKNIYSTHDNFYCDAISDSVVLTPDNNIYPCVFLAKPGNEIGKYENGIIYINEYELHHKTCMAKSICNENKKLILKKGNNL